MVSKIKGVETTGRHDHGLVKADTDVLTSDFFLINQRNLSNGR
jgi:hypothetical protein